MDEEMRFHLEQLTRRHAQRGLSEDEARRRALIEFGGVAIHQEAAREELRNRLLEDAARRTRCG